MNSNTTSKSKGRMGEDMDKNWLDFENDIRKEHALKYAEYERLRAEAPKGVKVGNRVLVAVGFIGHGFHWIRQECVVLETDGDSSKIRWPEECKILDRTEWVYWIPNCLITSVLPDQPLNGNEEKK